MSNISVVEKLKNKGMMTTVLSIPKPNDDIKEFQTMLNEMGFGEQLHWDENSPSGYYDEALIQAVVEFCNRNDIESDGTEITEEIGDRLIELYESLDEMQDLHEAWQEDKNEIELKVGSKSRGLISSLQTLLNDMGYGKQLNWSKYKNDGHYGNSTLAAVTALIEDEGLEGEDPNFISDTVAQTIMVRLGAFYGDKWMDNPKQEATQSEGSTLTEFQGDNFQGKKVLADDLFLPELEKIDRLAGEHGVKIHVTSSFRKDANVKGAIVTPSKMSNHMAGHAIDMNIVFPGGWANSQYLKKSNEDNWHESVKGFIDAIRDDEHLRWGGDFRTEDPVHIDDGLNVRSKEMWKKRFEATQLS